MFHTVILSDEEIRVLQKIVAKTSVPVVVDPVSKPKKLSKLEQTIASRNEYRAKKKRKT